MKANTNTLADYQDSECACKRCISYCESRPGWPLPEEAVRLIAAGLGNRLMKDYCVGGAYDGGDIHLLSPAIVGYEGNRAPYWQSGRCTFLTKDQRCELHDQGLKPFECRVAHHSEEGSKRTPPHKVAAMAWNTPEHQKIVFRFLTRKGGST